MAFRVGQKVARIGGRAVTLGAPPLEVPCTVSWVGLSDSGEEAINIAEFPAGIVGAFEPFYRAKFFRPITEKKTDIAIFQRILDKVNGRESVNG
jgi:hypothetical protein